MTWTSPSKMTSERTVITPEYAASLLEQNKANRPLNQRHVERIARQIRENKWVYNGDTIKLDVDGNILDGQHRLWACVETGIAIDTQVIKGLPKEVFTTLDTIAKPRSPQDTVHLMGVHLNRRDVATACMWLSRYEKGVLPYYRAPNSKVENSDVEQVLKAHIGLVDAVERVKCLRALKNTGLMAFLYYIIAAENKDLADLMVDTLYDTSGVSFDHPFYLLRSILDKNARMIGGGRRRDLVEISALVIKAANAVHAGKGLQVLRWNPTGKLAEKFPTLNVA